MRILFYYLFVSKSIHIWLVRGVNHLVIVYVRYSPPCLFGACVIVVIRKVLSERQKQNGNNLFAQCR